LDDAAPIRGQPVKEDTTMIAGNVKKYRATQLLTHMERALINLKRSYA
jgi:hypothetical protein